MKERLNSWLHNETKTSADGKYRHRLLVEKSTERGQALTVLADYVDRAHEDARRHLRQLASISLDPLEPVEEYPDPAEGYPSILSRQTRMGWFGEIVTGAIAEYLTPFGEDGWVVPAFLLRFHLVVFQHLEYARQTDLKAEKILPGRTGDDCLAFQMNESGQIIRTLACESKCLTAHNTNTLSHAHEKISYTPPIPVDVLRLIEVLNDYDDAESKRWKRALQLLFMGGPEAAPEVCCMISYICGNAPKQGERRTWASPDAPDMMYTSKNRLEVVELHIHSIGEVVDTVYRVSKHE